MEFIGKYGVTGFARKTRKGWEPLGWWAESSDGENLFREFESGSYATQEEALNAAIIAAHRALVPLLPS